MLFSKLLKALKGLFGCSCKGKSIREESTQQKTGSSSRQDSCDVQKQGHLGKPPVQTGDIVSGELAAPTLLSENPVQQEEPAGQNALEGTGTDGKLSRQIQDLEEENEELEDEIRKNRKKYDELKTEKLQVEETARNFERQVGDLSKQLKDTQDALTQKENTLGFIGDILEAKESTDDTASKLYGNVDAFVSFVRNDVRDLIKECKQNELLSVPQIDNEAEFFDSRLARWAVLQKKDWLKGRKTIAFVGEFSAGKTSIVNRLLDSGVEKDFKIQLPVSAKATTAIPTYICDQDDWHCRFVSPDNKVKDVSEKVFSAASKEVLAECHGIHSLIKYFVIFCKRPNLKNVSILDTPGFSSNDKEDSLRTMDVINECDALCWVVDINKGGLNKSSLKIIKDNLTKPLFIILNKIDLKEQRELENTFEEIKRTVKENELNVTDYIAFSSREKVDLILNVINKVENSNDDSFADDLRGFLGTCVNNLKDTKESLSKSLKSTMRQVDTLTTDLEGNLRKLAGKCSTAVEIPHFETHFFASDKYEMSQDEFGRLKKELDGAVELAEEIEGTNEQQDKAIELQTNEKIALAGIKALYSQAQKVCGKYDSLLEALKLIDR